MRGREELGRAVQATMDTPCIRWPPCPVCQGHIEPVMDVIVQFVSNWLIAFGTQENGDLVTDLEAQWAEDMRA